MDKHPHWLPQLIAQANKYNAAGSKFLDGHILEHIVHGRIYAEIHPHRGDDGNGTRSLRFSYSDPPLQQMPSRDKELAPLIRGVFLPEPGEIVGQAGHLPARIPIRRALRRAAQPAARTSRRGAVIAPIRTPIFTRWSRR